MLSKTIQCFFARSSAGKPAFQTKVPIPEFFKTEPIIEGQYEVTPPLTVPSHIPAPAYINNPKPVFGIYSGSPVVHNQDVIRSKFLLN